MKMLASVEHNNNSDSSKVAGGVKLFHTPFSIKDILTRNHHNESNVFRIENLPTFTSSQTNQFTDDSSSDFNLNKQLIISNKDTRAVGSSPAPSAVLNTNLPLTSVSKSVSDRQTFVGQKVTCWNDSCCLDYPIDMRRHYTNNNNESGVFY